MILSAIVVALAFSAWRWGPKAYRQAALLYWQHRCMDYAAPADQVVLDTLTTASTNPYAWPPQPSVRVVPQEWQALRGELGQVPDPSGATVFLHERTTPQGARRLVIVDVPPNGGIYAWPFLVIGRVIKPAGLTTEPADLRTDVLVAGDLGLQGARVRYFAGQPDPQNPAHFTIGVEIDGRTEMIDGWLTSDDRIVLQLREGK